jgi:hypothetical protein
MSAGRRLWAALRILDRQLVDRDGRPVGMVDDVELGPLDDSGTLYVTALYSGPGALSYRLGHRRYGRWMAQVHALVGSGEPEVDSARIPITRVSDMGIVIRVSAEREDLGDFSNERWFRDHVIDHIPGADDAPE